MLCCDCRESLCPNCDAFSHQSSTKRLHSRVLLSDGIRLPASHPLANHSKANVSATSSLPMSGTIASVLASQCPPPHRAPFSSAPSANPSYHRGAVSVDRLPIHSSINDEYGPMGTDGQYFQGEKSNKRATALAGPSAVLPLSSAPCARKASSCISASQAQIPQLVARSLPQGSSAFSSSLTNFSGVHAIPTGASDHSSAEGFLRAGASHKQSHALALAHTITAGNSHATTITTAATTTTSMETSRTTSIRLEAGTYDLVLIVDKMEEVGM